MFVERALGTVGGMYVLFSEKQYVSTYWTGLSGEIILGSEVVATDGRSFKGTVARDIFVSFFH